MLFGSDQQRLNRCLLPRAANSFKIIAIVEVVHEIKRNTLVFSFYMVVLYFLTGLYFI